MILVNPRKHGQPPYLIVLVHGGPGAPGEMFTVAKFISKRFGVLEPMQTKYSINGQVEELKQQIADNTDKPVTLVGWSWGAWLCFIVAAKYPNLVKKLILISSGPFEVKYSDNIMPTRLARMDSKERKQARTFISRFQYGKLNKPDLRRFGELMSKADSFDPVKKDGIQVEPQADIYESVWKEAEVLRKSGKLLKCGERIASPVVVMHGDYDPHPFEGVKKPLSRTLKNVKFILLQNCGHHPWLERRAKEQFYAVLEREL